MTKKQYKLATAEWLVENGGFTPSELYQQCLRDNLSKRQANRIAVLRLNHEIEKLKKLGVSIY